MTEKSKSMKVAVKLSQEVEHGNEEYKWRLVDISNERFWHLVTQMRWRLEEGNNVMFYKVGWEDDGSPKGINKGELKESINTIRRMAKTVDATVTNVEIFSSPLNPTMRLASVQIIQSNSAIDSIPNIRVAMIGDSNCGKSTLIGVLSQGELDDGAGLMRMEVFQHKHEIEKGHTSSISQQIIGFDDEGDVTNYECGMNIGCVDGREGGEWGSIIDISSKLVTLMDLAGGRKHLKTTVLGLTGFMPDYALLVVDAHAGIGPMTWEHVGIVLALQIPLIVVLTKVDIADKNSTQEMIAELQRMTQSPDGLRAPVLIKKMSDIDGLVHMLDGELLTKSNTALNADRGGGGIITPPNYDDPFVVDATTIDLIELNLNNENENENEKKNEKKKKKKSGIGGVISTKAINTNDDDDDDEFDGFDFGFGDNEDNDDDDDNAGFNTGLDDMCSMFFGGGNDNTNNNSDKDNDISKTQKEEEETDLPSFTLPLKKSPSTLTTPLVIDHHHENSNLNETTPGNTPCLGFQISEDSFGLTPNFQNDDPFNLQESGTPIESSFSDLKISIGGLNPETIPVSTPIKFGSIEEPYFVSNSPKLTNTRKRGRTVSMDQTHSYNKNDIELGNRKNRTRSIRKEKQRRVSMDLGVAFPAQIPMDPFSGTESIMSTISNDNASETSSVTSMTSGRFTPETPYVVPGRTRGFIDGFEKTVEHIPLMCVSSTSGEGLDMLKRLLFSLPCTQNWSKRQEFPAEFDICDLFEIDDGVVFGGTMLNGKMGVGCTYLLGPFMDGGYKKVQLRSARVAKQSCRSLVAGQQATITVSLTNDGAPMDIKWMRPGMVIIADVPGQAPCPATEFEADVFFLRTTPLKRGYQPVVHCNAIKQVAKVISYSSKEKKSPDGFRKSDNAVVHFKFQFFPEHLSIGRLVLIRDGLCKAFGRVRRIIEPKTAMMTEAVPLSSSSSSKKAMVKDQLSSFVSKRPMKTESTTTVRSPRHRQGLNVVSIIDR